MPFFAFLRINAPWLAAGAMLSFLSCFGQTFFIAVFAGEIRAEFGLSHGEWGGIFSAGTIASGIAMIWAGALTDRFRVRTLGTMVLVMLALACLAVAVVPDAGWLILVIFALRFTGQGMASHIAIVAMARWFVASRGRALSIATLGVATGEALLPIGFVALLAAGFGWRMLWVVAAGVVIVAAPLLVGLLQRERTPQSMANESQSTGMHGRHWTRAEVLRHSVFWMVMPLLIAPSLFTTSLFFQQVHLAEVKGWDHLQLVALFPVYTVTGVVSMLAMGWAVDRFGTGRLMPLYPLPFALAYLILSQATGTGVAALGMVMLGLGSGGHAMVSNAFWAEYFGTRHIGSVKAAVLAVLVVGSGLGPGISGLMIDAGIGFPLQMFGFAVWFALSAALVAVAMRKARRDLPRTAKVDIIGA